MRAPRRTSPRPNRCAAAGLYIVRVKTVAVTEIHLHFHPFTVQVAAL
eukprot:COSAG01_NODE_15053_length_1379_cov_2.450781_1_plen_46_part_10